MRCRFNNVLSRCRSVWLMTRFIRNGRIMKGEQDCEKGEFSNAPKADKRGRARNPVAVWKSKSVFIRL